MGLVGCDTAGSACISSMISEGVDTKYIAYSQKYNTDYSTLLLAPSGERTILTYRGCGSNLQLSDLDFNKITDKIDWIYMTSMVGHFDIYQAIIAKAKEWGAKIAFNPGGAELDQPDKLRAILPDIDILSVNKEEAQKIVSGQSMAELLANLRQFCPVVIVTDGVNGSVAADQQQAIQVGLYHPDEVSIDRTGAGDAFCSGFTLVYATSQDLRQAVYFASANSASVVMHVGAKPGILKSNVDQLRDPLDIKPLDLYG